VRTLGIASRSRLLLAYFQHTEPESGANGNATCRLTDSKSERGSRWPNAVQYVIIPFIT